MELPYTKINAHLVKGYIPEFNVVEGKRNLVIEVPDTEPSITFEDYLKAQLHYNVMCYFEDRQIKEYNDAYDFMFHQTDKIDSYLKVLKYYYIDMARLVFSYQRDFSENFSLIGNNVVPRNEEIKNRLALDIEAIMRDIQRLVEGKSDFETEINFPKLLQSVKSEDIFSKERLQNKNNLKAFTEALLFSYYGNEDESVYLEVK